MHTRVEAPGCSPAGIPDQSFLFSANQSGPKRPAAPGSDGRCDSSERPAAAAVSLAVDENVTLLSGCFVCLFVFCVGGGWGGLYCFQ